jgi:ABC-type Fe3+ transport system permease subunit
MHGNSVTVAVGAAVFLVLAGPLIWYLERRRGRQQGPALLIGLPAVYLGLLAALGAPKWLYVPCVALLVLSYLVQYAALRRKNTKQG